MRRGLPTLCATLLALGCTTIPVPAAPTVPSVPDPGDFDRFLGRHVDGEGRVAYAAARTDRADLDRYLAAVAATSPASDPERFGDDAQRLAYWICAYNAWVIAMVLDAWPIDSVNDVRNPLRFVHPGAGFFLLRRVQVGGERMSLYHLENRVIRRRFDEPRIHFALNCASGGCPRLPAEAFVGERLESQLARETRRFLSEARNVSVDLAARRIRLSKIFAWYEEDFTGWMERHDPDDPATLVGWLAAHAPGDVAARLVQCADCSVTFVDYDWSVNAQP